MISTIYTGTYREPEWKELKHWGIKGMKWGIRRYQNEDGTLTPEGKRRYGNVTVLEKTRANARGAAILSTAMMGGAGALIGAAGSNKSNIAKRAAIGGLIGAGSFLPLSALVVNNGIEDDKKAEAEQAVLRDINRLYRQGKYKELSKRYGMFDISQGKDIDPSLLNMAKTMKNIHVQELINGNEKMPKNLQDIYNRGSSHAKKEDKGSYNKWTGDYDLYNGPFNGINEESFARAKMLKDPKNKRLRKQALKTRNWNY